MENSKFFVYPPRAFGPKSQARARSAEIKRLRKSAGMTQEEFADLAGVSRHTVIRWEDGARSIRAYRFTALRKQLEVIL